MKKKRWLSILLSLSLLLTLLPAQALGEEEPDKMEIICTQTADCPAQVHEPDCPLWQEDSTGPEETGPGESASDESSPSETAPDETSPAEPGEPEETQPTAAEVLALIAALPDPGSVTAENAEAAETQLRELLALYQALDAGGQEEVGDAILRAIELKAAMDALSGEDSGQATLAETTTGVEYIDAAYDETTKKVTYTQKTTTGNVNVVADNIFPIWDEVWYVVNADVTISTRITVNGNVHLILADGCTLTASKGIYVPASDSLTIYGQANGTGKLTTGTPDSKFAGIGGNFNAYDVYACSSGHITINGGTVEATGSSGAGIGGGQSGSGIVTINGGTVTATGGSSAAGIGGGYGSGTVTIHGGTVKATGGQFGAGIGGGYDGSGTVTITGGTVTATGGSSAAGIGTGFTTNDTSITATITITGGFVTATGGVKFGSLSAGAAIGQGGKLSTTAGTEVTFITDDTNAVVLEQSGSASTMTGTVYGSPTLDTDATVPAGATLTIPAGSILTIDEGVTLTNNGTINGTINNQGTLINNGTINGTITGNQQAVEVEYQAYNEADGSFSTQKVYATPVTTQTSLGAGWYVVNSAAANNLTITGRITVRGDVHLILADGAKLTASNGIGVNTDSNSLTIYGQTGGTGKLSATGGTYQAGIGGTGSNSQSDANATGGPITIHGGTVTATGGNQAAGIGGGNCGSGTVTINGGEVTATGDVYGAGIGGGYMGSGTVTINGGTVTAKGSTSGAGIGTGFTSVDTSITATIIITGGFVTATGGVKNRLGAPGAAIGSGGGLSSSNSTDAEVAESNFTNAVVLRQNGEEGSTLTGQVYGEPTLDTDATVPAGASLLIPEGTSLTIASGTSLTNSGTIYVDTTLNQGGPSYGTLTNNGTIYYHLTVDGGTATAGTATYNGKTYATQGTTVTLTAEDQVGLTFNGEWTASPPSANVTFSKVDENDETNQNYQFTMPASPLTVTAGYTNAPTYTVTIPASVSIGDTATAAIEATGVNVAEGWSLNVTLTATSGTNNAFTLALSGHPDVTLGYTITQGEEKTTVKVNDTVLTVAGGTTDSSGSAELTFTMANQLKQYSGSYTGNVTFTVSVTEDEASDNSDNPGDTTGENP